MMLAVGAIKAELEISWGYDTETEKYFQSYVLFLSMLSAEASFYQR